MSVKLHMRAQLFPAHVMGGCGMGEYPGMAVVDSGGKHHQLSSPWILDGSIFPTSVGANHSLPIYAMVASQASLLANTIGAKNKSKI